MTYDKGAGAVFTRNRVFVWETDSTIGAEDHINALLSKKDRYFVSVDVMPVPKPTIDSAYLVTLVVKENVSEPADTVRHMDEE
jgi:hypothetical protein